MALNQLGLGFVFTAKDLASGVIQRVESSFTRMEGKTSAATRAVEANFRQFGRGLAVFGAGIAIAGSALGLADRAGKFEQALAAAGAAAGSTAAEAELLRSAALDAGLAMTGFSAEDAARTLARLTREGLSARDAMAELGPSLLLASITERSAEEAAGFLSDALDAFHLRAGDAGRIVDQLAAGMRTFGFTATELEPALKGVATGVQLTGASFEDAFLAVGLAKRVLPGVEQATRAANQAMLQLASADVARDLSKIGVAVKDEEGRLRPLVDILADVSERTAGMTEAQRATTLSSVFSARAAGGLSVIMNQLAAGVRDGSGTLLRGAAAVGFLREQMASAGGTAEEMRDRMLDTFEGQKKVLRASISSLATVIGEPFAQVFKPIVRTLADVFNRIAKIIAAIPAPVKKALAAFTVALGGVVSFAGGLMAAKAGAGLLAAGLKVVGVTAGGLMASFWPVLAVIGVLATVVAGFAVAFKGDIGGIRTFFENAFGRIKLLFQGLVQLFQDGAFSGAVMEELNRAENAGIKQFAIRVYQIIYRIKRFFVGIGEGFSAAIEAARPVFEAFVDALSDLGEAFGLVSGKAVEAGASIPSERFAEAGRVIGDVFGKVATVVVGALTIIIRVVTGIVNGVKEAFEFFKPVFQATADAVGSVVDAIRDLLGDLGVATGKAGEHASVWQEIGRIIGWVAGIIGTVLSAAVTVIAYALRGVIAVVLALIDAFEWLGGIISDVATTVYDFFAVTIPDAFTAISDAVSSFFQPIADFFTVTIPDAFQSFVDAVHEFFQPLIDFFGGVYDAISSVVDMITGAIQWIVDAVSWIGEQVDAFFTSEEEAAAEIQKKTDELFGPLYVPEAPAPAETQMLPIALSRPAMPAAEVIQVQEGSETRAPAGGGRGEDRPVQAHITLNVDGETLARVTARAERNAAARSFVPVPEAE